MIITNFNNFIQRIIKNPNDDFYHIINGCRHCKYAGNLHRHASYYRTVICEEITVRVKIQRVICPDCRKTHALIPSDLIPYYQHTIKTVVNFLEIISSRKSSYTNLIEDSKLLNPCFSLGHITFYNNRFKSNINSITYYFRVFCNIFIELPVRDCDVVNEILKFNLNLFNKEYFEKLDKSFLAIPK